MKSKKILSLLLTGAMTAALLAVPAQASEPPPVRVSSCKGNTLEVGENGEITGYKMRCEKSKLTTVRALQSCGFETIAAGDSFNDLGMIQASKAGFLFKSTAAIKADCPDIPAYEDFPELLNAIRGAL